MVPTEKNSKKRPLAPKVASTRVRKRQRLNSAINPPKPKNPARREVRLDDLQWKEVAMPDRLDDLEGFYGLEEIEGVEVVRDQKDGRVSFRTLDTKLKKDKAQAYANTEEESMLDPDLCSGSAQGEDEEEWAGISDEEAVQETTQALTEDVSLDNLIKDTDAKELGEDEGNSTLEVFGKLKAVRSILKRSGELPDMAKEGNTNKPKTKDSKSSEPAIDLAKNPFEGLEGGSPDVETDTSAWSNLNLSPDTLLSLSKLQFSRPTPIQAAAIPETLAGRDVIGKASTGSGKTLAFGIPILEHFLSKEIQHNKSKTRKVQKKQFPIALVLAPTRELAQQIKNHLEALFGGCTVEGPSIATVIGGLAIPKQQRLLANADVVIGTPGRLWELMSEGIGLINWLKGIKFLVVDEADRLLSEGNFKEAEEIFKALDRDDPENESGETTENEADKRQNRQTLVFSATFHKGLQQRLSGKTRPGGNLLNNQNSMEYLLKKLNFREEHPRFVDVNPVSQLAAGLKEGIIECGGTEKDLYLYALLLLHPNARVMVFTNSKSTVRRLACFLQNLFQPLTLPVLPLHSDMAQKARLSTIERFSKPKPAILVATDVAARGLDIPNVQLVVHYHVPGKADTYVHRSGRTARGDSTGISVILCAPDEVVATRRLAAKVHANHPSAGSRKGYLMRSLDIDRHIVSRLKTRVTLAQKIAAAMQAKEKANSANNLFREAAEDLGVEYDSEEFDRAPGRKGRGSQRRKRERVVRGLTKAEIGALRAELRELLSQRINVGVSERYLTSGSVDVNALLRGEGNSQFLGTVGELGFD